MKDWFKVMLANLVAGAIIVYWLRKNAEPAQAIVTESGGTQVYAGGNANIDLSPLIGIANRFLPPNILSIGKSVSSGTTELVASEGGKRITVLAYSITTSGSNAVEFRSNGATIWRQTFDAAAGKTGANLATSFPTRLFAGVASGNLEINTTNTADVSVTYFLENV